MSAAKKTTAADKRTLTLMTKAELQIRVEKLERANARLRTKNRELNRFYVETVERLEMLLAAD
jgi:hypothetical protein